MSSQQNASREGNSTIAHFRIECLNHYHSHRINIEQWISTCPSQISFTWKKPQWTKLSVLRPELGHRFHWLSKPFGHRSTCSRRLYLGHNYYNRTERIVHWLWKMEVALWNHSWLYVGLYNPNNRIHWHNPLTLTIIHNTFQNLRWRSPSKPIKFCLLKTCNQ